MLWKEKKHADNEERIVEAGLRGDGSGKAA
jgi:hypothetical protein